MNNTARNEHDSLGELRRIFDQLTIAIRGIRVDMRISRSRQVVYNVDFSLIFSHIWRKATTSQTGHVPAEEVVKRLQTLSNKSNVFKCVFTGASFLELLDSLNHHLEESRNFAFSADENYSRLKNAISAGLSVDKPESVFVASGVGQNVQDYFPKVTKNSNLDYSLQRIKNLFQPTGFLYGVGDLVRIESLRQHWAQVRTQYPILLDEMLSIRRDDRPMPARRFHFGVDCINIVTTLASSCVATDAVMRFVTKDGLIHRWCRAEGRSADVPHFIIGALMHQNEIGDLDEFFEEMGRRVEEILRDINNVASERDLKKLQMERIQTFRYMYLRRLLGKDNVALAEHETPDLAALIRDRKDFVNAFRSATEKIEGLGKELVTEYRAVFADDESLRVLSTGPESKVVNSIRRSFGL